MLTEKLNKESNKDLNRTLSEEFSSNKSNTVQSSSANSAENDAYVLGLNAAGLLAEVVGFETEEVVRSAYGTDIETYQGRHFIDFTGGIAVHACGHNHPEIVAAIVAQAQQVLHVSDTMRHAPQLELAHWLRNLFAGILPGDPEDPYTFLFKNSGSESIDAAAKLAIKATGRHKLAAFEGAFHGRSMLASALSRSKTVHWQAYEDFLNPLRANIIHLPAPRCSGCELRRDTAECCANGLEALLETHGSEIAAVFIEAQQGEGGYMPMAPAAGKKIRDLTRKHGVLLIADEIQAGCGRTGRWFAFQHLGIEPDIIVFGKAVGGGLPLAGIAARKELMERWQPGEHGTTFGGNPIACAAGLAALKIIARDGLVERAAETGAAIKARLQPYIGRFGIVEVRGNGLMIGVELRDAAGQPDYARCEAVKLKAREAGLMLLTCGAKIGKPSVDNAAIRLIPPLNVAPDVVERAMMIFLAALQDDLAQAV